MKAGGKEPQTLHFNVTLTRITTFLRPLSQIFNIKTCISHLRDPEEKDTTRKT
jgi:hypothetical protein